MKIKQHELIKLYDIILNNNAKALLLYGPNKEKIDSIYNILATKLNFIKTSFNESSINLSNLFIKLNSLNFFKQKELVQINIDRFNLDLIVSLLSNNLAHFPVFISNKINTKSQITKLFDKSNELISIGCYFSNTNDDIKFIILEQFNKLNKTIETTALNYLVHTFQDNHISLKREMDKLISYYHFDNNLTLEKVVKIIVNPIKGMDYDKFCINFFLEDLNKFLIELDIAYINHISHLILIRSLIKFNINLYKTKFFIKEESLISSLKHSLPHLFYRFRNELFYIIKNLTMHKTLNILHILQESEIEFKINGSKNYDIFYAIWLKITKC